MKLYEVTKDIEEMLERVEPDDEYFNDTIESLQVAWEEKAGNVSAYIGNLEATVTAIKNAEKNMADRRKSIANKVEGLKRYLMNNMDRLNIDKIETAHFVVKIKKNPIKVTINNEEEVPDDYWEKQVSWVINKTKIKKALKGDDNVKGAEIVQNRRLVIK